MPCILRHDISVILGDRENESGVALTRCRVRVGELGWGEKLDGSGIKLNALLGRGAAWWWGTWLSGVQKVFFPGAASTWKFADHEPSLHSLTMIPFSYGNPVSDRRRFQ